MPKGPKRPGKVLAPPTPGVPVRKLLVPGKPGAVTMANPQASPEATDKQSRTAPATRKVFAPSKPTPVAFAVLVHGDAAPFTLPPRIVCDECGARPGQVHAPDCTYAAWPVSVAGAEYRPTFGWSLGAPSNSCITCGAMGILGYSSVSAMLHPENPETPAMIEHDRLLHKWWCSWWAAHPGVTPF